MSTYVSRRAETRLEAELKDTRVVAVSGARQALTRGARPAFVTNMTLALVEAAKAGTGIAVLPRYLGDAEPSLRHLPMPGEPTEAISITVHKDLKQTPPVRVVLDFLNGCLDADKRLLLGESGG